MRMFQQWSWQSRTKLLASIRSWPWRKTMLKVLLKTKRESLLIDRFQWNSAGTTGTLRDSQSKIRTHESANAYRHGTSTEGGKKWGEVQWVNAQMSEKRREPKAIIGTANFMLFEDWSWWSKKRKAGLMKNESIVVMIMEFTSCCSIKPERN